MKAFLISCFLFGMPVLLALMGLGFLADGYSDAYYLRVASPQQNALIVGSSRSARGIQPAILNRELSNEYHQQIYNFSFSIPLSPFGRLYLEGIQKKLDQKTKNSFFIVSVDPWSIAGNIKAPEDSALFSEEKGFLGNVRRINTAPNFSYLLKYYPAPYITLLTGKIHRKIFNYRPPRQLHEDGWYETSPAMDSVSIRQHLQWVLSSFRIEQANSAISCTRKSWLVKTIASLQQHGDVYLVRMPVHADILALENQFCPGFDKTIDSIALQQHVPYFNFTPSADKYTYTDGSHLWKESATLVSKQLAQLIIEYRHSR